MYTIILHKKIPTQNTTRPKNFAESFMISQQTQPNNFQSSITKCRRSSQYGNRDHKPGRGHNLDLCINKIIASLTRPHTNIGTVWQLTPENRKPIHSNNIICRNQYHDNSSKENSSNDNMSRTIRPGQFIQTTIRLNENSSKRQIA